MKKFKVVTLGYRTHQYAHHGYIDQFRKRSCRSADDREEEHLCIVNTCTLSESVDRSSKHQIRSLLKKNPKGTIDGIVGFPGKKEGDFQDACSLIEQVFPKVQMFSYPMRKRTRVALYPNWVPPKELLRRRKGRLPLSDKTACAQTESFVGWVMPVLVGRNGKKGMTQNVLPLQINKTHHTVNEIVNMQLYENTAEGFKGRVA